MKQAWRAKGRSRPHRAQPARASAGDRPHNTLRSLPRPPCSPSVGLVPHPGHHIKHLLFGFPASPSSLWSSTAAIGAFRQGFPTRAPCVAGPRLVPTALRGRRGHASLWGWGISPPKCGPPHLFPFCRGGWWRPRGWLLRESGPDVTQSPTVPVACNLHHGRAAGRLRPEAGRRSPSVGSGGSLGNRRRPGVPGGRVLRLRTRRCRGRSREVPETGF